MKKNYMKPSMVAVKINEQILAGSLTKNEGFVEEGFGKRHRGGSFTDFDFEDEEE